MACRNSPCYTQHGDILIHLQKEVMGWLGMKIQKDFHKCWQNLNSALKDLRCWTEVVWKAVRVGVDVALRALRAVKEEVVKVCRESKVLIERLTKLSVKTGARTAVTAAAMIAVKAGAKAATKGTVKATAKESTKLAAKGYLKVANPFGIAADLAQAGLEATGHKEAGRLVGVGGNTASAAMIGAAVAGPPGAVVGALGGFVLWGVGEVAGGLVDRFF